MHEKETPIASQLNELRQKLRQMRLADLRKAYCQLRESYYYTAKSLGAFIPRYRRQ